MTGAASHRVLSWSSFLFALVDTTVEVFVELLRFFRRAKHSLAILIVVNAPNVDALHVHVFDDSRSVLLVLPGNLEALLELLLDVAHQALVAVFVLHLLVETDVQVDLVGVHIHRSFLPPELLDRMHSVCQGRSCTIANFFVGTVLELLCCDESFKKVLCTLTQLRVPLLARVVLLVHLCSCTTQL